ncbi:MAG: NTP transferase domain-containing protein [Desulfobulbaceae bacterium]|nr:NTP transferase domain-containing protein [Desulfobulbaceae bacterium]
MSRPQTKNIIALVLAAGSAKRFGSSKQLAEFDGKPLAKRALDTTVTVFGDSTVLVVGHVWRAVARSCSPLPGFLIVNDQHERGLGSSIACATRTVQHAAQAIIVILADQPLITAKHLQCLRDNWSGADNEIVTTGFGDTTGPPVLFPRACFNDLATLQGETGGRHLLSDERFAVRKVGFEPASVDIDTPAALDELIGR